MDEGRKVGESSTEKAAAYHSEVRLESSPSAIGFSDSCPCCGNKKRRCLQPASSFRKKLLVLDSADPDPVISDHRRVTSLSLTPPPPAFREIYADPIFPMSPPPLPPTTPTIDRRPPATDTPFAALEKALERSNSTLTEEKGVICTAKREKKARLKNREDAASPEEARVCVRCSCGVVRRILLVRNILP